MGLDIKNLSKNLTLDEACVTSSKFDNTPGKTEIENLKMVAAKIFQPCRDHFGKPLKVNSGYRSQAVNKAVGGAKSSQHLTGQALDLDFGNREDNKKLFDYVRKNLIFDQIINEDNYSWIHISYNAPHNRREVLEMVKVNGKSTYKKL
jgi:zinc D-Ala-D-Ala carboxypeptidase